MAPTDPTVTPDLRFDKAVSFVLSEEGGYVNDPHDPGGETNWGISRRAYPEEDIARLTRPQAMAIYLRDFWVPLRCQALPPPLDLVLLDSAVNCGPNRAVRWVQAALGVPVDGWVGPVTIEQARLSPRNFARGVLRRRMQHYRSLPTWSRFGVGWSNRMRRLAIAAGLPDPTT